MLYLPATALAVAAVLTVGFVVRSPSRLNEAHVLHLEGAVSSLALSDNGKLLAAGCRPGLGATDARSGKAVIWRRDTLVETAVIQRPQWVNDIAFSKAGDLLAIAASTYFGPGSSGSSEPRSPGVSGNITLWTTQDWKQRAILDHPEGVFACQISPNDETLASLSGHSPREVGDVMLWNIETRELVDRFPGHRGAVRSTLERWGGGSLQFSRTGEFLAVAEFRSSRGDAVRFWDLKSGQGQRELSLEHDGISGLSLSPDGQTIALATETRHTKVYNVASQTMRQSLQGIANLRAKVVAFSPDGQVLAIAGAVSRTGAFEPFSPDQWYGVVGLWDVDRSRCIAQTVIRERSAAVLALVYAPDGRTVVTGDMGGNVRIWDVPEHLWPKVLYRR